MDEISYRHTPDMGQISGWGGDGDPNGGDGYEACCQDMLDAGVKWIIEHPDSDFHLQGYEGVYGFVKPVGPDAQALDEVVSAASKGESTGAQHQTIMERLLFIRQNGWEKYQEKMRENKRRERRKEIAADKE